MSRTRGSKWIRRDRPTPEERQAEAEARFHTDAFNNRCITTLTCEMCGGRKADYVDAVHIAGQAYRDGWRFQKLEFNGKLDDEESVLCQHCTDGKR